MSIPGLEPHRYSELLVGIRNLGIAHREITKLDWPDRKFQHIKEPNKREMSKESEGFLGQWLINKPRGVDGGEYK